MSEVLQEYVASGGARLRVDRAAGIIRGVKLLGLVSRNGRRYREAALALAASLYEGAKVNINHPPGHPLSPRDYRDRLGVIRGVEYRAGNGLFGDLHFNPRHALSEQLVWDAEHAPQNVGLSHNVLARTTRSGEETVVEAIVQVQSIDLVADPASTSGLFEHRDSVKSGGAARRSEQDGQGGPSDEWSSLTLEEIRAHRPDLVRELQRAYEHELESARRKLDALAAREAAAQRRERILTLLEEHGLPGPAADGGAESAIVSREFFESLMRASDEASLGRLVEERAELVRSACEWKSGRREGPGRPRSRDQLAAFHEGTERPRTAADFAASVRRR